MRLSCLYVGMLGSPESSMVTDISYGSRAIQPFLCTLFLLALLLPAVTAFGTHMGQPVIINGQHLNAATIHALERQYGTSMTPGNYWYDRRTGLYGYVGGPPLSIGIAGLNIGGSLRSDASGSTINVSINGRRIHPVEYQFYTQCFGRVEPGRYWMNANGIGGREGGPALFDASVCLPQQNENRIKPYDSPLRERYRYKDTPDEFKR